MNRKMLGVFLIALGLRAALALWAGPEHALAVDSLGYLHAAELLATPGGPFALHVVPPFTPETTVMPGYPLLILFLGGHVWLLVWANALMGALTCAFAYAAGLRLWRKEGPAVLGSLLLAFDPVSVLHGHFLLSEAPYICAFTGAFALLAWALDVDRVAAYAVAGLAFGVATLVRPVGLFYGVFAAMVVFAFSHGAIRRGLLAFALSSLIIPGAWTVRNQYVSGRAAFCTADKLNLHPTGIPTLEARHASKMGKLVKMMGGHGMEMAAWMVLHDPDYDAMTWWKPRAAGMMTGTTTLVKRHPTLGVAVLLYTLFLAVVYLFALRVVMIALTYFAAGNRSTSFRNPFLGIALAASPIVYHVVLDVTLTTCYYRQRLPVMPFVLMLAGLGLWLLRRDKVVPEENHVR